MLEEESTGDIISMYVHTQLSVILDLCQNPRAIEISIWVLLQGLYKVHCSLEDARGSMFPHMRNLNIHYVY